MRLPLLRDHAKPGCDRLAAQSDCADAGHACARRPSAAVRGLAGNSRPEFPVRGLWRCKDKTTFFSRTTPYRYASSKRSGCSSNSDPRRCRCARRASAQRHRKPRRRPARRRRRKALAKKQHTKKQSEQHSICKSANLRRVAEFQRAEIAQPRSTSAKQHRNNKCGRNFPRGSGIAAWRKLSTPRCRPPRWCG